MKKAVRIQCGLLLAGLLLLSGCWNYRDIEDIAVAMGMAIDKTEDGEYLLTTEIAHPLDKELQSYRIEAKGRTVFDCMRNTGKKLENKVYWSNAQVLILSEAVAEEGLLPFVDIAERNREIRPTLQIIVSREKTAKELFETKGLATDIISIELASILKNSEQNISKASIPALYRVVDVLCSQGENVSLPAVRKVLNGDEETAELGGTAVFDEKKLVGYLSDEESRALLFVQDEIEGGLLVVKDPYSAAQNPYITLEITRNMTTVEPELVNKSLTMNVRMKTEAVMGENDTGADFSGEDANGRLEQYAQAMLSESVQNLIQRVQYDYNADIFGFGNAVQSKMPGFWKETGLNWYNGGFQNLKVRVTSEIEIVDNGLVKEPIGGGA